MAVVAWLVFGVDAVAMCLGRVGLLLIAGAFGAGIFAGWLMFG